MQKKAMHLKPVLAVDIGNTTVALGIFDTGCLVRVTRVPTADFPALPLPFLGGKGADGFSGIVVSSVVPRLNPWIIQALKPLSSALP
ncbi:MAG TPA: hypothetical protein DD727_04855, partial [Clostridiales bacterium]|nr:hypothetical protein [Clostridiales bacterium]